MLFLQAENIYTFYLYCGISLFAILFAFMSQTISVNYHKRTDAVNACIKRTFNVVPFIMSFVILWFFAAFNNIGVDKPAYRIIFEEASWSNVLNPDQEFGFRILNIIVKFFIPNSSFMLFFLASLTLVLLFTTLYYFRNKIHLGFSVLAYCALNYFQSYNLVRIYLASAILLFGLRFIFRGKWIKLIYFLFIFLAGSMHYSAFGMFIPYMIFVVYNRIRMNERVKTVLYALFCGLVFVGGILLIPYLKNINFMSRYDYVFADISFSGLGMFQPIVHVFLLFFWYLGWRNKSDVKINNFGITYICISFIVGLLSYSVDMFGRALILFNCIHLLYIPFILQHLKIVAIDRKYLLLQDSSMRVQLTEKNYINYRYIVIFTIAFYIINFIIYLNGYWLSDGIGKFFFIWN